MLGYHLVLVTLYCGLQSVLSKTIRIGETKTHIQYNNMSIILNPLGNVQLARVYLH